MYDLDKKIAESLLQIKAIKLNPANHFTWASGWYSPIYCDNRKVLSYPAVRKEICNGFVKIISEKYPDVYIIAGVATGAIAHGALVADRLNKPFVYVRSSPKTHGLNNQVEGECWQNAKVVVIEDLVSTGGSSLCAVEALRENGCDVLGMVAIFTYEFPTAKENFAAADVHLDTLSNYSTMIELAVQEGYVHADELQTLQEWRRDPANWKR